MIFLVKIISLNHNNVYNYKISIFFMTDEKRRQGRLSRFLEEAVIYGVIVLSAAGIGTCSGKYLHNRCYNNSSTFNHGVSKQGVAESSETYRFSDGLDGFWEYTLHHDKAMIEILTGHLDTSSLTFRVYAFLKGHSPKDYAKVFTYRTDSGDSSVKRIDIPEFGARWFRGIDSHYNSHWDFFEKASIALAMARREAFSRNPSSRYLEELNQIPRMSDPIKKISEILHQPLQEK